MRHATHTFSRRLGALLLCLALLVGLLPATALAAAPNGQVIYVGNKNVTNGGYWTTDSDGSVTQYTKEGTPTDNYIHYDADDNTLTLHNATIKEALDYGDNPPYSLISGAAIGVLNQNGDAKLAIQLEGTNTIEDVSTGIFVLAHSSSTGDATLTITGSGSLDASGSLNGIMVQSNSGDATLTIQSADVTLTSNSGNGVTVQAGSADSSGGHTITLSVEGGSLTASGSTGISFDSASSKTVSATKLTVSNNAIVRANDVGSKISNVDLQIGKGNNSLGGIVFDGNQGTVYGNVILQEDLTIESGQTLTVPEGSSLNCNNNLTNKGTILVETGGTVSGNLSGGTPLTTPSISQQPQSMTVTEGSTAEFSITASDAQTYQWQRKATYTESEWENISDATTTSYTTADTTTNMNGYQYRCVVKSASGVSVISQTATLTVQAKPASVPVTGVTLDKTTLELFTGGSATLTATVQPDDATNKNVTWQSDNANVATVQNGTVNAVGAGKATITVTTEDGNKTATCAVTLEKPYTPPPYIPPTKTPSEQAIDKIEDAKEGSTVKITLRTGQTKLDKEVFEELAGRDVTLEISLPGGVTWTVNGEDIPKTADLTDLDMGVSLNTSTIPVDLINAITGEIGTVQLTLKHDGPFGFTMTLTAPVGKENEGLWANLYHYDEDAGEMVYQTAAQVDEDGNAALPFDHASQYAIVLDSKSHDLPFTDLAANAWYTDAVAYVYRHGIMEGMSDTAFAPNKSLTRAEAVQVLYNLEGQPTVSGNATFPDLVYEWYKPAIAWAEQTGVVDGYEDGTFRPDEPVTREEFAQMLYNYAAYKGYDLTAEGDLTAFPDGSEVQEWAVPAMAWANGNALINGHDDGTLDPAGTTTRAQAAAILMRFDQNLAE